MPQWGAEFEAVAGAIYWAEEKDLTGCVIRTDHRALVEFFAPGHQPTEDEIGRYGTEAREFFQAIQATIEYVAPEQNPAVALCQKAKEKRIREDAEEGQHTVRVVEAWLNGWPRVAEALEEMMARIVDTGMDHERDWLNGGIVLQTGLTLKDMQAIIRAYEDTYPFTFRVGTEKDEDAADEWG